MLDFEVLQVDDLEEEEEDEVCEIAGVLVCRLDTEPPEAIANAGLLSTRIELLNFLMSNSLSPSGRELLLFDAVAPFLHARDLCIGGGAISGLVSLKKERGKSSVEEGLHGTSRS